MNNQIKELSGNRRRTQQKAKLGAKLKMILNEIKTEKKKDNKNFDEIKKLKFELVKLKYVNNPNKLQSESNELNKFNLYIKIYTRLNKKY